MSCRINKQRSWMARILLESLCWHSSIFITLTYRPETVPSVHGGRHTLYPPDLQRFWKRLRKRLGARRLRYYAVGEYGEETWRPHYHAIVFGLSDESLVKVGRHLVHPEVHQAWGMGYTSAGSLTPERAAYCAQYVCKKLTRVEDPRTFDILRGTWPEFCTMSKKPGLGSKTVAGLAEALVQADPTAEDVPTELVMPDGRRLPMPGYIAAKMREELGIPRLASERPPRVTEPSEFVEVVDMTPAGVLTRRVSVREQKAREAEAKAARKRYHKREGLSSGQKEAQAFKERSGRRYVGASGAGGRELVPRGRIVEGPLDCATVVYAALLNAFAEKEPGPNQPAGEECSDSAEAASVGVDKPGEACYDTRD